MYTVEFLDEDAVITTLSEDDDQEDGDKQQSVG